MAARTTAVVFSVFLSLVANAAPSAAGEPTPEARAKAMDLLKRGAAQMEAGEYAQALALYNDAYKIVPSAKIHYNIATAYDGLARPAQAYDAYQTFLQNAKDAPPEFVKRAEGRLGALAHQLGTLVVVTDAPLSTLHVDGRSLDPSRTGTKVEPGEHTLIGRAGSKSAWATVTIAAGETRTVTLRLEASAPQGAVAPPPPAGAFEVTGRADEPAPRAFYTRPWFLAGAAVVVAGAVVSALLLTRTAEYPSADKQVSW